MIKDPEVTRRRSTLLREIYQAPRTRAQLDSIGLVCVSGDLTHLKRLGLIRRRDLAWPCAPMWLFVGGP